MTPSGTPTRSGLIKRLRAAIFAASLTPPVKLSTRMPDLEAWKMPHRSVDMKDWELALNMAQNVHRPDRSRLLDLYDSILVDSHLASVMESRVLRVVRSKFKLTGADGKAKPELMTLFEQRWFEDFLRYAAEATFKGHTLIELGELDRPGQLRAVNRIDPRNVLPWTGHVVKMQGDEKGYPFREPPLADYLVEVGRASDLGVLSQVAPVAIVKKYAIGSWSDYVEKFGIPARWVKSDTTDKNRIKQLESVMQNMVSSAYAVIQGSEEIQVMPTPGTDAHKVFDELISRMNSEISKRVLGQDGTSDNKDASGTYGSLKVLQGVAEDRHQADKSSVLYTINNELFPRLIKLGYPLTGVRFQWDELRDMSPTELVDAVTKLGQVFDIDPKHVEERTGIRILGARRMPGEVGPGGQPPTDPPSDPPTKPGNPPGKGKQGKGDPAPSAKLRTEEGEDEDEEDGAWPRNNVSLCGVCGGSQDIMAALETLASVGDLSDDDKERVMREASQDEPWSQTYFDRTAGALRTGFIDAWEGDPNNLPEHFPDPVARTVMEASIYRFGKDKTRAVALELNAMARDAKGYADFKRKVDESGIYGIYQRWLKTEYVNAVNSGVQGSRYYKMKRDVADLPYWEYQTMEDNQVRPAHALLDRKVFEHKDRIWDTIYPPNGWRCRCHVRPRYEDGTFEPEPLNERKAEDYLAKAEMAKMKKDGFNINRAKIGEVFKRDAAYRAQLKKDNIKAPGLGVKESYGPDEHERQTLDSILGRDLPKAGAPAADRDAAREALFRGADSVILKDIWGRPWGMKLDTYEFHTNPKDPKYGPQKRYETAHLIHDVLANPDEVWMDGSDTGNSPGLAKYKYVKFYDGLPVAVVAHAVLQPGQEAAMRVYTWYRIDAKMQVTTRQGLLLKRNTR